MFCSDCTCVQQQKKKNISNFTMSKTPRSPTESVASDFSESSIFCGVGSPRPKPRLLSGTVFGHVEGAFDEKTLPIGYECDKKTLNGKGAEETKKPLENGGKGTEESEIPQENGAEVAEEKSPNGMDEKTEVDGEENVGAEAGDIETSDAVTADVATDAKGPLAVSEAVSCQTFADVRKANFH